MLPTHFGVPSSAVIAACRFLSDYPQGSRSGASSASTLQRASSSSSAGHWVLHCTSGASVELLAWHPSRWALENASFPSGLVQTMGFSISESACESSPLDASALLSSLAIHPKQHLMFQAHDKAAIFLTSSWGTTKTSATKGKHGAPIVTQKEKALVEPVSAIADTLDFFHENSCFDSQSQPRTRPSHGRNEIRLA